MAAAETANEKWETYFARNQERFITEWFELLRFATVGKEAGAGAECRACVAWLQRQLSGLGFAAQIIESSGQPLLLAERPGAAHLPTLLFYGHYDVQPADPLELWRSPPFQPELRDAKVYARGALDNKGQFFAVLKALEAVVAAGAYGGTIKVLLEGEEESGSGGLAGLLRQNELEVAADVLLVCDSNMADLSTPTIVMGLRGIVVLELRLGGLKRDLHSGIHGGTVLNPANELARLIAGLHKPDGSIAVAGYYEGLLPLDPAEGALLERFPLNEAELAAEIGVKPSGGEQALPYLVRRGFRPSLDVNGFYSGYTGEGPKTIIPASATVKLSARLAAGQDPERCLKLLIEHLRQAAPAELQLEILCAQAEGGALRADLSSPYVAKAAAVLKELFQKDVVYLWEGASVPVLGLLAQASGGAVVAVGFGVEENNMHGPNESYSLEQFRRCFLFAAAFVAALAEHK